MIGSTLNERYLIKSRLGKGAMGFVYLADDIQTGREVALKMIAGELALDSSMLERFRREGEMLRRLSHPNIVSLVDAFEHDEQYVIVMEYVPGGNLLDLLKSGPLQVDQALRIALDLCDALIRSHRLGIVHRDIKPENILIAADGTPKLADFGVARLSQGTRMTRSGLQVGTPYYMSPEAWEGKTLDAQTDIWSLGVVLFEMLSGQVPFSGDTGPAVMNKVLTTRPPDLKKLRSEVPPGVAKVVARMLTRDVNQRYKSTRQVAADLESSSQAAMDIVKPKSGTAPISRGKGLLAGFGILAVVGALMFWVWNLGLFPKAGAPETTPIATIVSPVVVPLPSSTATTPPSIPPQFAGVIKIVSQSPLSGAQSFLGIEIKQGAELAFEQLGGNLRAMGFDIQFVAYDDQADPDVGVSNAEDIIADPAVLCGVGHLNSSVMIPSSEIYHKAGLPFVSPANTNPLVTTRGYLEVNRIVGRDDGQIFALEDYIFEELGMKSVYIVHDGTPYGQEQANSFRSAAVQDGISITAFAAVGDLNDLASLVPSVISKNPDALFFGGIYDYSQIASFFRKARTAGYQGAFLGTDAMDSPDLVAAAGSVLTFGAGTYYTAVYAPASFYKADTFIADYTARFGSAPVDFSIQAYDAMGICLQAIQQAAKESAGVPERSAVAAMIRRLPYKGLTGTISFDDIGDPLSAAYYIVKVTATFSSNWEDNQIVKEVRINSLGR